MSTLAAVASSTNGGRRSSLTRGNKLVCPGCLAEGDPLYHFKTLHMNPDFAHELNAIQIHRRDREGCGHVFSPGEPSILQAYLSGELIPRELLDNAKDKIQSLQDQVAELQYSNEAQTTSS